MFVSDVPVTEGEVVEVWSAGGGGYGDPFDREPERVLADVQSGIISCARAKEVYGVIIRCTDEHLERFEIDADGTAAARSSAPAPP
jgi:N-methylhydantoinase B